MVRNDSNLVRTVKIPEIIRLQRNAMDIVILDDIFDIITFIHPSAVQFLLNNDTMLQKYMFIKEKASKRRFWVESRHHLFYIWHFFGYRALPEEYPSYDSTGMNDFCHAI